MRKILYGLLFIFSSLALPFTLQAQIFRPFFRHLTANDGLSQGSVYAIMKDTCGFLWFGTKDGLNRYDGYNFKVFIHNQSDSTSLSDNFVTVLFCDKKGRIWVGTQYGHLDLYIPQLEVFRKIQLDKLTKGPLSQSAITEDDRGNIWLGTSDKGIVEISIKDKIHNELLASTEVPFNYSITNWNDKNTKAFKSDLVSALLYDESGTLWAGIGKELFSLKPEYNPKTGKSILREIKLYHFALSKRVDIPDILNLYQDSNGNIWAGTSEGLYVLDKAKKLFVPYKGRGIKPSSGIRSITEDSKGRLWLGTFSNVFILDLKSNSFIPMLDLLNNNGGAICIKQDKSGTIWIGTNGYGIYTYNPNIVHFNSFTKKSGIKWSNPSIRSIFQDSKGRLWIGTYGGLYVMNREKDSYRMINVRMSNPVKSIMQDREGKIWLTSDLGIACINPNKILFMWDRNNKLNLTNKNFVKYFSHIPGDSLSLSSSFVTGIFQDKNNTIWAVTPGSLEKLNTKTFRWRHYYFNKNPGPQNDPSPTSIIQTSDGTIWFTSRSGLWRFNTVSKSFVNYTAGYGENKLSSNVTISLCKDSFNYDSILWIGTEGGGLDRLNINTGAITSFTESDGLPDNVIYGILTDSKGNLWLSSNKGLTEFNPLTKSITNYKAVDGLQGNEYNTGAYYKSPQGELFFGGINGFDSFLPDEEADIKNNPKVVITNIALFNKTLIIGDSTGILKQSPQFTKSITLNYKQNELAFTFSYLDYTNPRNNKYEYKLSGFNKNFILSGTQHTVSYTNLDPGKYLFIVRGKNGNGKWSTHEAKLLINILPPFWMTWWFRIVVVLLFIAIGPAIYFRRVSMLSKEKQQQEMFSRRLIESQENERKRIAAEIHDSLGQNLLVMKNRALLALEKLELTDDLRDDLMEISGTASSTLQEMREISHNLRPYELDRFGITEALKSVVEKVNDSSTISFTINIDDIDGTLTKEAEINIYRIVQESLNNILKHSDATKAEVKIIKSITGLEIEISDNGNGFNDSIKESLWKSFNKDKFDNHGFGLNSIYERVRLVGGTCSIKSALKLGTTIKINIPV